MTLQGYLLIDCNKQKETIKRVLVEVEKIRKEDFEKAERGFIGGLNYITYSTNLNRGYSNADVFVGLHGKDHEYFNKVVERFKKIDPSIKIKNNFGKINSLQM